MSASPFSSISDIIAQQTSVSSSTIFFAPNTNFIKLFQHAQEIYFFKDARMGNTAASASVAGRYTSLWMYNGIPSSGNTTIPGNSAVVCNRLDTGSLYQNDPWNGGKLWCMGAVAASTQPGTLIMYDRLVHIGGLSGTTITPQTVSASANRWTGSNCVGNQIYVEIFTAIGATQVKINATYINQNGTTSVTPSASIGGTGLSESTRIIPLPLASGDTGVTSVNSIILSATTATAGNFGVFIGHPFMTIPLVTPSVGIVKDTIFGVPSIPQIEANADIVMMWLANGTTAPQIYGELRLLEK